MDVLPKVLKILRFPDSTLLKVSEPVVNSIPDNKYLQELLNDMVKTMESYNAVGLAAIQVGVPLRALVLKSSNGPIKVINPVIKEIKGSVLSYEGCLSFPGLTMRVKRPEAAAVQYFDETGILKTTEMDNVLGRAIQHEMDHLNGKTFLDVVSKVERSTGLNKYRIATRKLKNVLAKMDM